MKKLTALIISLLCIAALLCSCKIIRPVELTEVIKANTNDKDIVILDYTDPLSEAAPHVTDFYLRLFNALDGGKENVIFSPLSVAEAFAMCSNGADGETLRQFSEAFGISAESLTRFLNTYRNTLESDEYATITHANSIWINDTHKFIPNEDFVLAADGYFDAEVYKTPFGPSTAKDINGWIKKSTNDMIPKIVDTVPEDAMLYLANAIAFEAEWPEVYEKGYVRDATFTTEAGEKQDCELMYSTESNFISDENSVGFIKHYKNSNYAFVAILPNENISVSDYLATLTGNKLSAMLAASSPSTVFAAIPKFEAEYSTDLKDAFISLGLKDAFDVSRANFSEMGELTDKTGENLYIGRALHKAYIQVAEKGTKAGAATVIEILCGSSAPTEPVTIHLDRPFVYMIIDTNLNLPIFIGTLMNLDN